MDQNMTDDKYEELAQLLGSQDPLDFQEYWNRVEGKIVRHLNGWKLDASPEVMANVMQKLWKQRTKFDAKRKGIIPWTEAVARRTAQDTMKSQAVFDGLARLNGGLYQLELPDVGRSYRDPDPDTGEPSGSPDIRDAGKLTEDKVTGAETYREMIDALESMPEGRAGAMAYRYIEGYSLAEIADRMDVSVSAAENLLMHGRRALAALMAEHGVAAPSGTLPIVSQQYVAEGRLITGSGAVDYERCGPQDTSTVTVRKL